MHIILFCFLPLACEMASDATAIEKLNSLRNEKYGPAIDRQMKIIRESQTPITENKQATETLEVLVRFRNKWFPLLEREVDAKKGDVGKFAGAGNFKIHAIIDDSNVIVAAKNGLYWIQGIPTGKLQRDIRLGYYFFVCEGTRKFGQDNVKCFRVVKSFKEDSATLRLDNK